MPDPWPNKICSSTKPLQLVVACFGRKTKQNKTSRELERTEGYVKGRSGRREETKVIRYTIRRPAFGDVQKPEPPACLFRPRFPSSPPKWPAGYKKLSERGLWPLHAQSFPTLRSPLFFLSPVQPRRHDRRPLPLSRRSPRRPRCQCPVGLPPSVPNHGGGCDCVS